MRDPRGFMKHERSTPQKEEASSRIQHFNEFVLDVDPNHPIDQATRCMGCGVPFCHSGCPLGNLIPDFNESVHSKDWKKAFELLTETNNFPEFTGRICPAPCEGSCVLGINEDPVSIEYIEKSIIETAYQNGWVKPNQSKDKTGKRVAVVGSGPAGLAAADQLNKAGHDVTVFERNTRVGGLLRYGIPDFKLGKDIVQRRVDVMKQSGIEFQLNTNIGTDISWDHLDRNFDAIVLCIGSTIPRDLQIPGRQYKGIHFAMDYLERNNKRVAGDEVPDMIAIEGKNVVVIGGGDTGSDCIGTSNRLGASSIVQIEILGKPPVERTTSNPWPQWPMVLRTSSSHEEGCDREWAVMTKEFLSDDGEHLSGIKTVQVEWGLDEDGKRQLKELANTEEVIPCERVFLAMGFLHPQKEGIVEQLGLDLDQRGNILAKDYQTKMDKVFVAGDARRGQSLVVWAISEGREAAIQVDEFLQGEISILRSKEKSLLAV